MKIGEMNIDIFKKVIHEAAMELIMKDKKKLDTHEIGFRLLGAVNSFTNHQYELNQNELSKRMENIRQMMEGK